MDCSTAEKNVHRGKTSVVASQDMGFNSTSAILTDSPKLSDLVLECDGFIQIEHVEKCNSGRRIKEILPVLDVIGKLPSFIDPKLDTVPCESDFYDKWARDPRTDSPTRAPMRPISVSAKYCSIMQSMQNLPKQRLETTATPTVSVPLPKSSPGRIIPKDISCNSLDRIIEHYHQLFPSAAENNTRPSLKLGKTTISYTHPPRGCNIAKTVKGDIEQDESKCQQDVDNLSQAQDETTDMGTNNQNAVIIPVESGEPSQSLGVPALSNQSNCIIDIASNSTNASQPNLPVKKFGLQQIALQANHAKIDWSSSINRSDSLCQLARFWTWRPKKSGGKSMTSVSSSVLVDDLDTSAKHLKREKTLIRKLARQNGLISSGILYDVLGKKDKDHPPDKYGMDGKIRFKNSTGSRPGSRSRKERSGKQGRSSCGISFKNTTESNIRLPSSADVQQPRLEEHPTSSCCNQFSSQDKVTNQTYDLCKDNKVTCGNVKARDSLHSGNNFDASQSEKCTAYDRKTHALKVSNSSETGLSMHRSEDVSTSKTPESKQRHQNDSELPRVQFMDLNDLKVVFGHITKGKASSARSKRTKVGFRPIGLPVRLKSRESVTQRCD